ncbi:MAG: hypothetical protein DLM52_00125 [Chthoniobacterales bacterium]|nr:MAG: hypothetical protein DLM52_00125 [Chthoniobacterales bacterium]
MLYPVIPTVPGYRDKHVEATLGSDAGAMLWQSLPYSYIQSRSVFHDRELPLWDRWNSAGTPLLGQGISMLGDPLHLFVVIFRGAAWAWDIKFLLGKVLFCWGIGLCVLHSSKNLSSALLLTFSSAFIGFFYHRFIHPAFFSLCYAPWILLAWLAFAAARSRRKETACGVLLVAASWFELNSGTVKEAYMLLLSMHASGLLFFLVSSRTNQLRKTGHLLCAGISFILISVPVWFTFLYSLRESFTAYNRPHAWQLQPALLIGLFDDIFYRALNPTATIVSPSGNFLILLGVLLCLGNLRMLSGLRLWRALCLSAALAYALAFGIVPAALITKIPFLGNVDHLDNVFSSALIVYCILLAGFGLSSYFQNSNRRGSCVIPLVGLLALFSLFLGFAQAEQSPPVTFKPFGYPGPHNLFIAIYITSLFVCSIALLWLIRWRRTGPPVTANLLTVICLLALHWRFGLHLNSGLASLDDFVINPQVRVKLTCASPAIDFLKRQPAAFRAAGFVDTLFPGYNAIAGIESIYGVDPLINPYYRELLLASGVKLAWTWRWVIEKTTLKSALPIYSLLNVRYFLDERRDHARPLMPLDRVAQLDLTIYQNRNCWPRAFYTTMTTSYQNLGEFVTLERKEDGRPFAAVQVTDLPALSQQVTTWEEMARRDIVPARDYLLTSNNTSFTIDAPGAGVVVLTETFLPKDFIVRVNGARANYFRVNHAFRGLELPGRGVYRISFSYWPRYFTTVLLLSGLGYVLLVTWLILGLRTAHTPNVS